MPWTSGTKIEALNQIFDELVILNANIPQSFVTLTDTPANYTGEGSKIVAVKGDESALEFVVSGVIDDKKVMVSNDDTTPDYLLSKLVAGTNITLTEQNGGGNENIKVDADDIFSFEAIVGSDARCNYATIQAAIAAGHTSIFVTEGTYEITSTIELPTNCYIIGENPTATIINGWNGGAPVTVFEAKDDNDNVTLENLHIQNASIGVNIDNAHYIEVKNCYISATLNPIKTSNSPNENMFINNRFLAVGGYLPTVDFNSLMNSHITHNIFDSDVPLKITTSFGNIFNNNNFKDENITVESSDYNTFNDNIMNTCGIKLNDCDHFVINNNVLNSSSAEGILLEGGCKHNTISNNNIVTPTTNGINIIENSAYNIISNNQIVNPSGGGILCNSDTVEITNNDITTAVDYGIKLLDSDTCLISNNRIHTVTGSSPTGIWVKNSSHNIINGNMVHNAGSNCYLDEGDVQCLENVITSNHFRQGIDGVSYYGVCYRNLVSDNVIRYNSRDGIRLYGIGNCARNSYLNNMIFGNTGVGINLVTAAIDETMLTSNQLYGNGTAIIDNGSNTVNANNNT